MNILDRLLDAAYPARVGGRPDAHTHLRRIWTDLLRQARRLEQYAGLATNPGLERSLRAMADEDGQQAAQLREKLVAAGFPPPPLTERPTTAGASQWARLVDVLDLHRETRNRLIEAAALWMRDDPALGEFLEELAVREERHLVQLGDLIARTDPQAAD